MKKNVLVLSGGASSEYNVSLSSGQEVVKNLDKEKYNVDFLILPKKGNFDLGIFKNRKPDVVFIAIHGLYGEDGKIQGMLELMKIPYTGSGVLASSLGMDKLIFRKLLDSQKIKYPKFQVNSSKGLKGGKFFVKPHDQGSSIGVTFVENKSKLNEAIRFAKKYSPIVLVDEYIDGLELTCPVLGNDEPIALPVIEIVPNGTFFDYKSKYSDGGAEEIVPARISKSMTKRIQKIAVDVYKLVGCSGFGRVDFILRKSTPYVLEINTIPGMTPNSLFPKSAREFGLTYQQLLDKIIDYAIKN